MKLEVFENGKEKIGIEVIGEGHTLLNILKEEAWSAGAKQASYIIKHPYMSKPKIIVRGKNPKKVLMDAAQRIVDESKEFSTLFSRETKKK
ncbi:MAG: DNA-directed RNA polymerase subunit L [Candidatus Micrarchaeota archaeon]|nr:DNA-directed RNA polymerase subunit L [Candidatus Micrarchaeota archaeon]